MSDRTSQQERVTATHKLLPPPRRTVALFGFTAPLWLARAIGVLVLAAFVGASYVLYTEVQHARADTAYRACQVDALQRSATVDGLLDLLTRANVELQTRDARDDVRAIRRDTVNELDALRRDREQARTEQAQLCKRP